MKPKIWAIAILLFSAQFCAAQVPATAPAAEQQAKAWLDVFNSADRSALLAFLQKNRPNAVDRLDSAMEFRERSGGLQLVEIEESTPTRFTAFVQEKDSDQFGHIAVEVEPAPPYRIINFEIRAIPRPAKFAIPRLNQKEAIEALNRKLQEEAARDSFSGTALVAQNGMVLFQHAYGLADRATNAPNTLDTQFRLGSMNKMFTAVSVLQLVQSGKLQLNDAFGKYLSDYPNKDMASKVTIQQLLTHTGGTGDIFGPEFDKHRLELKTLQDYVRLYGDRPVAFEPGSRFEYSNYGFLLLGVIIEKVSNQTYYDYVREHVFKPAGMNSTDSLPEDQPVASRSTGYMKEASGPWMENKDTLPYRGTSAGGGYSTVVDLYRFAMALQQHKLLDAAHTEMLVTGKVDTGHGPDKYAFGFFETDSNGLKCFGHAGGAPGMNGELKICPKAGYVIAVLANLDPPAAQRASDFIANRLPLNK